jgi:cell fate (sporulation/competence/biofilm development) regulator YlbF (YheA/YmcA/DUF963 family)
MHRLLKILKTQVQSNSSSKILIQSCAALRQNYSTFDRESSECEEADFKNAEQQLHVPVMLNEVLKHLVEDTPHFTVTVFNFKNCCFIVFKTLYCIRRIWT